MNNKTPVKRSYSYSASARTYSSELDIQLAQDTGPYNMELYDSKKVLQTDTKPESNKVQSGNNVKNHLKFSNGTLRNNGKKTETTMLLSDNNSNNLSVAMNN